MLDALCRDPELRDIVAQALRDQGKKEATAALYDAYQKCSPWQRVEFEDALRDLYSVPTRPPLWTKNWKTRYRREPFWGRFELAWAGIAVRVRRMVKPLEQRPSPPLKSVEEILKEPAQREDFAERCEDCGGLVERPTGLPVCPETALWTALFQVQFLGEARDDGAEEIFELFDD